MRTSAASVGSTCRQPRASSHCAIWPLSYWLTLHPRVSMQNRLPAAKPLITRKLSLGPLNMPATSPPGIKMIIPRRYAHAWPSLLGSDRRTSSCHGLPAGKRGPASQKATPQSYAKTVMNGKLPPNPVHLSRSSATTTNRVADRHCPWQKPCAVLHCMAAWFTPKRGIQKRSPSVFAAFLRGSRAPALTPPISYVTAIGPRNHQESTWPVPDSPGASM